MNNISLINWEKQKKKNKENGYYNKKSVFDKINLVFKIWMALILN